MPKIKLKDLPVNERMDIEDSKSTAGGYKLQNATISSWSISGDGHEPPTEEVEVGARETMLKNTSHFKD